MPIPTRPRREIPDGKRIQHVHKVFTLEIDENTTVTCSPDGKLTFISKGIEEGEPVEDIIIVTAATIFQVANMLNATRKTHLVDK